VPGNVMTLNAQLFATPFANPPNATLPVKNPETPSVMLNVKNPIVKSNAPIRLVKLKIALNVLPFVNNLTVLLTAKLPNLNVKPSVKNPDVIGNATNPNAPNLNVNSFVKTPPVNPKLNAALVLLVLLESLSPCLKKPK